MKQSYCFCFSVSLLNYRFSKAPSGRQKANALKYPKFILAATDSQKFNIGKHFCSWKLDYTNWHD